MGKKTLIGATVYVSTVENEKIKEQAGEKKLTVSNYIRQVLGLDTNIRGPKRKSTDTAKKKEIPLERKKSKKFKKKVVTKSVKKIPVKNTQQPDKQPSLF